MFSKVTTLALSGLDANKVSVEVDIRNGLFAINIVGLAGKAVQESKERVFTAIKNSGFEMPMRRITINLSPADLIKNSSSFDLPIAVALLVATNQIKVDIVKSIIWGELSLEGETLESRGALTIADYTKTAGYENLFLPKINAGEAEIVAGIKIIGVDKLSTLGSIGSTGTILKIQPEKQNVSEEIDEKEKLPRKGRESAGIGAGNIAGIKNNFDFAFMRGQSSVKRVAEIAAAGGHNLLLNGVPGSGKTFLGKCIAGILPTMEYQEMIEVTKIHSISGLLKTRGLINQRPFRSPHHTSSRISLIGGGTKLRPGEITLSHRGVLFLDEFNEFDSLTLESLRQPLEDKEVVISRASGVVAYPANFMLVAAMNPCKCGYYGDTENTCVCTPYDIQRFRRKLSGPIVDRIDLQTYVNKVSSSELLSDDLSEESWRIRLRVEKARKRQLLRFSKLGIRGVYANADLNQEQLKKSLYLSTEGRSLLGSVIEKLGISARGYFRLLKVSRTIADIEGSEDVKKSHIVEAISYRIVTK